MLRVELSPNWTVYGDTRSLSLLHHSATALVDYSLELTYLLFGLICDRALILRKVFMYPLPHLIS